MALEDSWGFFLLLLGFIGLTVQEEPVSVELSCGVGPIYMVLAPGRPHRLDCHQGIMDSPVNVTWLRDGVPVVDSEAVQMLPNGSLVVQAGSEGRREAVEGGYNCLSSNQFGALTSRTLNLQFPSLSRFLKHPESRMAHVGESVRFHCHVDGRPTPNITWEKDQMPIPAGPRFISLPNGALQILRVQEEDVGSYRCMASNLARKRFSQSATLTVTEGPSHALEQLIIEVPPQNTTVVSGHPTVMECMAQGQPKPTVSWSRQDGKPIAPDVVVVETNLLIQDTHRHHAGFYVCRANKPKMQESVIATAVLRVLAPPEILQPPETLSLSRGNTARLMCNSSGEPSPALRWLRNGLPVLSNGRVKAHSPSVLLINQLGHDDAGYYQCVAANSLGMACASAGLSVIVREGLPSAPRLLSALPQSSTTALLTWQCPELNSDQIIGFSVHYQQAGGSDNMEYQFAVNNDTTEYYVKDLLPHTSYTFYVVAYSPIGASRPSLPITMEMLEDVPSSPPQVSLLSTSPTNIRVIWLPLDSQYSHGAVTRYRIEYCTVDQEDDVYSVEVSGNETQVTLRGMEPNQGYRIRMAAGTRAGFGIPSEWALHHTPNYFNHTMVIFAPSELRVKAKMDSLYVTWQPPPNVTQMSGYKLYCQEVELKELTNDRNPKGERNLGTQPIKLKKRTRQYEITDLAPDRLYEVKVRAYSKHSDGYVAVWKGRTERAPVTVKGPPRGIVPPPPPSSIRASANSSTSIWLRWERPRLSSALNIVNYTVRCSPAGIRNASLISYYTSSAQEILLGPLKPFTRYALAVQSNGQQVDSPFSSTVEESTFSDRPSSPPTELQLSALDATSVLVSWLPPLEPNGIIIEYKILYSGNSSQPDHVWSSVSRDGTIVSTEVQGLQSSTRYFFKMGACTEVGVGPFSPVKAVHTPSEGFELDVQSVTGIIVGVCLGLICILLCMFLSLHGDKVREVSRELDSGALPSQYRRGRSTAAPGPECTDHYELETLMSPGDQDPAAPMTEVTEEHSLMGMSPGDNSLAQEPVSAWNGSVSCHWANRISKYRDTITEDCLDPKNGHQSAGASIDCEKPLEIPSTDTRKNDHDEFSSACSNHIEAEVIVHSELSDLEGDQDAETEGEGPQVTQGPSSSNQLVPKLEQGPHCEKEQLSCPTTSSPTPEGPTNHSVLLEDGEVQVCMDRWGNHIPNPWGEELTNSFHSPEPSLTCNGHIVREKTQHTLQHPACPGLSHCTQAAHS